jgi:chromosome segregation ATPase
MGDLTNTLRWLAHASGEHDEARRAAMKQAADAIESLTARLAEAEEALRGNASFIKAQAEERARIEAELAKCVASMERLESGAQKLLAEVNRARAEALEEAAKVARDCDIYEGDFLINTDIRATCATAIRALATQENTDAA